MSNIKFTTSFCEILIRIFGFKISYIKNLQRFLKSYNTDIVTSNRRCSNITLHVNKILSIQDKHCFENVSPPHPQSCSKSIDRVQFYPIKNHFQLLRVIITAMDSPFLPERFWPNPQIARNTFNFFHLWLKLELEILILSRILKLKLQFEIEVKFELKVEYFRCSWRLNKF